MSEETRNAEVRLTADVDPYVESVQKAGTETGKLSKSVDSLTDKFQKLHKEAGKKLLLFGAGTGAAAVGLAKQAADLEKRMGTLQASAATTNKSMTTFDKQIVKLGKDLPVTNAEAIALITTLDKLGVSGQRNLRNVSESMVRLSAATGEDMSGLTTGMVELSRQMGTLHSGNMADFSNSLLHVSQRAGTSAQGIVNFAAAIAPVGRMAGMTQKEVMGVGAAFAKTGADGFAGTNAFNKIVNDITRAVADGSPVVNKYANLIGVTRAEFESLGATEQVIRMFEEVNAAGEEGIHILDQLGIDGTRSLTAIQRAVQGGGLREAVAAATGAPAGTLATASQSAMDGFSDSLTKTGTAMQRLAQIAGGPFAQAFQPVLTTFNALLGVGNSLAETLAPLGARFAGLAGGIAALLGGSMLMSRVRNAVMLAGFVAQSSPVQAIRGGLQVGRGLATGRTVVNEQSRRAANLQQWQADRQAWVIGGRQGPEPERPRDMMRGWAAPGYRAAVAAGTAMGGRAPGGPSLTGRVLASPLNLATWFVRQQTEMVRNARVGGSDRTAPFLDPLARGMLRAQDTLRDPAGAMSRFGTQQAPLAGVQNQSRWQNIRGAMAHPGAFLAGFRQSTSNITAAAADPRTAALAAYAARRGTAADPYATRRSAAGAAMPDAVMNRLAAAGTNAAAAVNANAKAATANMKATNAQTSASRMVTAAFGNLAKATLHGQVQSIMTTGTNVAKGGWAAGRSLGAGALGLVGGPWGAAAIGATLGGSALYKRAQASDDVDNDNAATVDAYRAALGLATTELGSFSAAVRDATKALPKPRTYADTETVSSEVIELGQTPGRELVNPEVRNFAGSADSLAAWLSRINFTDPRELQLAQADIVQATGSPDVAQQAVSRYFARGGPEAGTDWEGLAGAIQGEQAAKGEGFWGFANTALTHLGVGGSATSREMITDTFNDITQQAQRNQTEVNPEFARQTRVNEIAEMAASLITPELGNNWTGKSEQETMTQFMSQLEQGMGGLLPEGTDLDFYAATFAKDMEEAGVDLTNTGEKAKAFLEYLNEKVPGLEELDYADTAKLDQLAQSRMSSAETRMRRAGAVGAAFYEDPAVMRALKDPGDVNAQYTATLNLLQTAQGQVAEQANGAAGGLNEAGVAASNLAGSFADVDAALQAAKAANGDPTSDQWRLLTQAQQMNTVAQQMEAPFLTRAERVGQSARQYELTMQGDRSDPEFQQNQLRDIQRLAGDRNEHAEYLKSIIQAYKQFGVSIERMNEDRDTSLRHQEEDFQRSMLHAEQDFLRSREHQQEDFNKSMERMAEDMAANLYDPMRRVYAQYTTDAGTLLHNLEDQNRRIAEQTANISRLREMGLSQQSIDVLDLTSADQAQNVARITNDVQHDPRMIEEINSQVAKRVQNTTDLVANETNKTFRRSVEDFEQGAERSEQAYAQMVERANQAQEQGLARSADQFALGLERMRQDMALMHEEISGTYAELVAQATGLIESHIGQLGAGAINSINEVAAHIRNAGLDQGWTWQVTASASRSMVNQERQIANQREQWEADARAWAKANPSGYGNANLPVGTGPQRYLAEGGIAVKATNAMIGEHGPEAVFPLNSHGTAFLAGMYQEITRQLVREMGTVATPVLGGGGSNYVDASTNFSGPIKVESQDPNEMARKLQEKARVKKLTRPTATVS